ncbi:universal stress protein [Nocardioides pyridinolyticus]
MTVAVAHQVSPTSLLAIQQAASEAQYRGTDLAVLHVTDSALDADRREAYRLGIADDIERALGSDVSVDWRLHLVTSKADIGGEVVALAEEVGADLLVIGARRRSPVGKAFLGSVAQTIILQADVPVLVVKTP